MDFRNISCPTSENVLPKAISKYHVSMLAFPSHVFQNPFQNKRSSTSSTTTSYQAEISKIYTCSIYHCHRGSYKNSLFIAHENEKWCNFVVRIDSPALISYYFVCAVSLYFSLFSFSVDSTTSWGIVVSLLILEYI